MFLISLDEEKISHFFYVFFVLLPYLGQDILPFSYMAADHWCLSLMNDSVLHRCMIKIPSLHCLLGFTRKHDTHGIGLLGVVH